ncbi:MAG: thioredoxin domain-containing protein [Dehalococcoidia bacterium]
MAEDENPEAQSVPAEHAESGPLPAAPEPQRPLWTYLAVPVSIVLGAAIIAGAIWYTRDDRSDDELVQAIAELQAQVAVLGDAPASGVDDGGGASTAQDLRTVFTNYARQSGVNDSQFQACLGKQANVELLNDHVNRGRALGVTGTPTFFINNKKVVGAQPQALFEEVINAELSGSPTELTRYSAAIQQLAATTPPRFEIMPMNVDLDGAHFEGDEDARVVVAEFSDFQCPFCKRWVEQTMDPLLQKYGEDLRLAFLHFPITQLHPNAGNASVAAMCAGEQGKFWEMHDLLFARQSEWAALK